MIALDLSRRAQAAAGPARPAAWPTVGISQILPPVLLLMVVGALGRVPLVGGGGISVPILLNDLVVATFVGWGLLVALRRTRYVLDAPATFALLFALVGGSSAIFTAMEYRLSLVESAYSLAYLARWLLYFGIYVVVINCLRRRDLEWAWSALEWAVLIFAGFGILQSAFLPGFAQIVQPDAGWDVQGRRLVSTFLDPNFAGAWITMALLIQGARIAYGRPVAWWKPLLLGVALMLSFSRGAILALITGALLIVVVRGATRRMLRLIAVVLLALVIVSPFLADIAIATQRLSITDHSAVARVVSWLWALEVLGDHLFFGVGFNTYGFVHMEYGFGGEAQASAFALNGGLLFIAVMTGLVGLVFYAGMLFLVFVRCRRLWRRPRDPQGAALGLGVAAATVALLAHSLFLNSLLYVFLMESFWLLWGMTFVAHSQPLEESPGV